MTTVLHASDSAELLTLVPSLAGFTPRESIVLLPFERSRSHGAMRLDLPDGAIPLDDYAEAAIALVGHVPGTDAVAVVTYTDAAPTADADGLALPQADAVAALLHAAAARGLHVLDALCVTPQGWAGYLVAEPELHALADLPPAPEIPGIADVTGDQSAGAELPAADLAEKERVGRALRDLTMVLAGEAAGQERTDAQGSPEALIGMVLLDDMTAFFETLLDAPEDLPPMILAPLIWCLERPRYRDVAIVQWARGRSAGVRALDAQLAYASRGRPVPDDLGETMMGVGPRPDADRLRLALHVVRAAAAVAPRQSRPGPLAVAAWLSWALGQSTHAAHYLDLIVDIDPEYGLAALIAQMVNAGMLPEWAFRPDAAADPDESAPTSRAGRGSSRGSRGR